MARPVIGRPLPRVEGKGKVTGSCLYSADVILPDALWVGFLRSPYPHAKILHIDTGRARRLPGVKAIVTGKDVIPRLEGCTLLDKPVMATDRVRYVGEKVAGIAAVDKELVEEALGLIAVEYEELPAVFDPIEAMKPESPLLHPDYSAYKGINLNKEPSLRNVRSVERASKGDIAQGFVESDLIFENRFETHRVHQAFIEPRAAVLEIDNLGRVAIWQCHQSPFSIRKWLANHRDIPEEMITVHSVATGGSFGGKQGPEDVICLYYLAKATGKPVKYVESYSEELMDGQPRHSAVITLRTGVKKDGRLWAWDGKIFYNGGAYGARTPRNGMNGTFMLAGSYRTPHTSITGYIVYTNQVPAGYFRGPGEVQTLFAVESHMDMMAEKLGLDPLEFRLKNVLREGDTKPTDEPLRDPRGIDVLKRVGQISGWRRAKPRSSRPNILIGRGLAMGDRHIAPGQSNAELFLEADGSLRLATSVRDVGVGAYTMHRQVAAEVLGVEPELVGIDPMGTEGPYDDGVRGAKGTHIEGQAVHRAATSMIEVLRRKAAEYWKVSEEEVRWEKGCARLKGGKKVLTLPELARMSNGQSLRAFGHYEAETPEIYSFQSLAAEVEVDTETGKVKVRHLYFAYDQTKVINPIIHQGQIDGAVIQGLGFPLMEHLVVEDGRVSTLSLGDYKIPTISDIPRLTTSLVKAKEGFGPFGTKSVAECGISVVTPAITNAIYDATGVRITKLPVKPEEILRALRNKMLP